MRLSPQLAISSCHWITLDEKIKETVNDSVDAWHVGQCNEAVCTVCTFDYEKVARRSQRPGPLDEVLTVATIASAHPVFSGAVLDKWAASNVLYFEQKQFGAEQSVMFGASLSLLRFRLGSRGRSGGGVRHRLFGVVSLSVRQSPRLGQH